MLDLGRETGRMNKGGGESGLGVGDAWPPFNNSKLFRISRLGTESS